MVRKKQKQTMKMKVRTAPPGMSMMRRKRAKRMERPRRLRSMVWLLCW